jgi:ribosomal protein L25 (general stress protein Ctc)
MRLNFKVGLKDMRKYSVYQGSYPKVGEVLTLHGKGTSFKVIVTDIQTHTGGGQVYFVGLLTDVG